MAGGIDGASRREHQLAVGVMTGVEGGYEDGVVPRRVQAAVGLVREPRLP